MLFVIISAVILALILGPIRHYYRIPDLGTIRELIKDSHISYLEVSSQFFFSLKTVSFHNHLENIVPTTITAPTVPIKGSIYELRSELVGTFAFRRTEDGRPMIYLGQVIKKGETVGFITALRIPTPVLSPIDGKIIGLPVTDNWPVQYGQLVLLIEKNGNSLV